MSTHYLLSLFDDTINDVLSPPTGLSVVTGNYVIRVPDDVAVKDPVSVSDIITQKYSSILTSNGNFTQVVYDDLLDASEINASASSGVVLGPKGMNSLFSGGVLQTSPLSLTWGGFGAGPSQALLTYEVFQYVDSDTTAGVYTRSYQEVSTGIAPITVQVSFNNGSTFHTVSDKTVFFLAGPDQGATLVLKFTHTGATLGRFFLGSWAVVF